MTSLKFEIALLYYKRPQMVLNALNSVKNLDYDNWHLTFIDDSGDSSFKDTLFSFGLDNSKITYVSVGMSDSVKLANGGSIFGKYINDSFENNDSDILILLCDDDALENTYLSSLNKFYQENPEEHWGYCHVRFYNPEIEPYTSNHPTPGDRTLNTWTLNSYTLPIYPSCSVDSSQVSFRIKSLINANCKFPYPQTRDLDRYMFESAFPFFGWCKFTNCVGQVKGWFKNQLGARYAMTKKEYF